MYFFINLLIYEHFLKDEKAPQIPYTNSNLYTLIFTIALGSLFYLFIKKIKKLITNKERK